MSPAQIARRKEENRLTLAGMVTELAYVVGLAILCCFACALIYFILR